MSNLHFLSFSTLDGFKEYDSLESFNVAFDYGQRVYGLGSCWYSTSLDDFLSVVRDDSCDKSGDVKFDFFICSSSDLEQIIDYIVKVVKK